MTDPMEELRQASAEVSGVAVLSPAAQAVLDAVNKELDEAPWNLTFIADSAAAAALRAAADQVVPEPPMLVPGGRTYEEAWTATVQDAIRHQLLAIAAELEGR
jgi:hypothetical protein